MDTKKKKKKKVDIDFNSPEIIAIQKQRILNQLSMGRSLNMICKKKGMPTRQRVNRWRDPQSGTFDYQFAVNYAYERENQADIHCDEIEEIQRRVLAGEVDPNSARVAIDALKWVAGRKNAHYRDKMIEITPDALTEQIHIIRIPDNGRDNVHISNGSIQNQLVEENPIEQDDQ